MEGWINILIFANDYLAERRLWRLQQGWYIRIPTYWICSSFWKKIDIFDPIQLSFQNKFRIQNILNQRKVTGLDDNDNDDEAEVNAEDDSDEEI